MSNIIDSFNKQELEKLKLLKTSPIKPFNVGDNVSVKYKITEGASTRIQAFNGVVIAKSKSFENYSATFTVRKMSNADGVERIFPLNSPFIESIEVNKVGIVRLAKLFYLRERTGKSARIRERIVKSSKA